MSQKKKFLNNMYNLFIEKDELTTQDLLSCGFTNKDLTRLIENGKLRRVKRGFYTLPNADGLLLYSNVLEVRHKFAESKKALERCLYFDPSNGSAAARIFGNSVWDGDFDRAFSCMDVLMKSDKESYLHDSHLWLYLLQFVSDVPEQYRDKVKNMTFDDIAVLDDDPRYFDKETANKVRTKILEKDFASAITLISSSKEHAEKRVYVEYTLRLLSLADSAYKRRQAIYEMLVEDENYSQLVKELAEIDKKYGLSSMERCLYLLASDMVSMKTSKKIPKEGQCSSLSLSSAAESHQYKLALTLNRFNCVQNPDQENYAVSMMLTKINSEVDKLRSMKMARRIGAEEFAKVTSRLMSGDLEGAFQNLNFYLAQMGKLEYRSYIVSLIKLSLLENDLSFIEPMLALSNLSEDGYRFDVSVHIADFYSAVGKGDLKRAAIYLDILSNSENLGGVPINTTEMRESLNKEMRRLGISEADVGFRVEGEDIVTKTSSQEGLAVVQAMTDVTPGREAASCKKVEDRVDDYLYLSTIVDNIINGDNIVLLEPMSDEDTSNILDIIGRVKEVKAFTIESGDNTKQVVLRYCGRVGKFIPVSKTLGWANNAFGRHNFDNAIELYESVLPLLPEPKTFIYANLGMSYYKRAQDGDCVSAIDYLTLATVQAKKEGNESFDYSDLVRELRERTGYNGVKVKSDDSENTNTKGIQFMKVEHKVSE